MCLKETGWENVDWIHISGQGQVVSSCEHGTKAIPLNLCMWGGGVLDCLRTRWPQEKYSAALKTLLTGYGRRPYNDALLFSLSRFKDCENRSFSTDSSKSRLRSASYSHLYRCNHLAVGCCCIWQTFWCTELCAYFQRSCIQPRIAAAGVYLSKMTL
jgi:hypothetical protein